MRYYYSLDQSFERRERILNDEEPEPIKLFEETAEIVHDLETNINSDWWGVWKSGDSTLVADFDTKEEAEKAFYANEGEMIYCIIHDC